MKSNQRTAEQRHLSTGLGVVGPALVCGFAAAVAVWTAWFVTHLPWLGIPEQISVPALIAVWLGVLGIGLSRVRVRAIMTGVLAGLVSAVLGLLVLGSKIAPPAEAGATLAGAVRPGAALIALGFLGLGTGLGAAGGVFARLAVPGVPACVLAADPRRLWLARFAVVAAVAVAPLLFIGGLVTSTNSGMAVPDWPNTYGSNMFLYPLGPRAAPDIYLEHAHRLFGTLVGLATMTLMVYTVAVDRRRWVKVAAVVAFVLVCLQGVLGGARVLQDERLLAMMHGVLAQLLFGLVVAIAAFLSPAFSTRVAGEVRADPVVRRFRFLATGLLHALILQLLLGAAYRHFRADHALWSHAGFSVVVAVFATGAGFVATSIREEIGGAGVAARGIRRVGWLLVGVVAVQFVLGWITFMVGGRGHAADSPLQAIIRTAHQANGALLLAMSSLAFTWARWLARQAAQPAAPTQAAVSPA